MSTSHRRIRFFFMLFLALAVPIIAEAQVKHDDFLETIMEEYRTKAELWRPVIFEAAKKLFWSLAILEFCWVAILMGNRRVDIMEWAAELVRHVMFIGFFYAVLLRRFSVFPSRSPWAANQSTACLNASSTGRCGSPNSRTAFSQLT